MAFAYKDRIKTSTTTTGTGTLTLSGTAPTGFRPFSAFTDGDQVPYYVGTGADWEVRTGVVGSSGTTLTRGDLLSSSTGTPVSFSAGTKDVFCALPAELVGWNQIASIATTSGSSVSFTSIPAYYSDLLMVFEGVSHNNGSNTTLGIELSDNNGTNWSTGTGTLTPSAAATATFYGQVSIPGYRLPAGSVVSSVADLAADRTLVGGGLTRVYRLAAGINAIRIAVSAGTLDAGTITLFGRL